MALPRAEFIPDGVLEARALRLLHEHETQKGKITTLPVPVEKIVSATLGLAIEYTDEFDAWESPGDTVLACVDPSYRGRPTVLMNMRHAAHFERYFGTEQFSLAHEGGHWVLHFHRGTVPNQLTLDGVGQESPAGPVLCRELGTRDSREFQAERFAAYLLLPEHLLRLAIAGLDLTRPSVMTALARDSGVSKSAMCKRLAQLGLIVLGPQGQVVLPTPWTGAML